ncbi:putative DNA polymerase beta subunit [Streptomyces sp. Tu6071]|uniref:nucleotidyltransferase domain-containing protein n=1 Tax=Streptomyces sp. Tu6071 TaxID=355249 RepID=UPI00020E6539|nr:putative DNA polymerase beta subunit [Streptomyces sp. Tu6071]
MRNDELQAMAARLTEVDGIVAVALGGSRARGLHRPDSDYDLGLYYRGGLDTAALRALAGEGVEVSEPGGWGPWVNGGAWLTVGEDRVDWIYRDLDRVEAVWEGCREGRFETGFQPGHPLGFHSPAYVGEVAVCQVLADPTGALTALRTATRDYPPPLRAAVVENARWEAPFILAAARKGAKSADAAYVAGCLFRATGLLAHALHAHAGTYVLNEKGALHAAATLPTTPRGLTPRAQSLFTRLGTTPQTLHAALDDAEALVAEVMGVVGVVGA